MRISVLSLVVLICGLQQICARYVPIFPWTEGNQPNMRQDWSTYDDDDLFGLAEKDKYDDKDYKNLVAAIFCGDNEEDEDEATEKVLVINDNDENEYETKTSEHGFNIEDHGNGIMIYSRKPEFTSNTHNLFDITKSSEETAKVEEDKDGESNKSSTGKDVILKWTISFGYPGNQFTTDYNALTKSSEETKDDDSLNKIDAGLDDEDSLLPLIFGGSRSSEETNDNKDSDHILKEIDEFFKELGMNDDDHDAKNTNHDDISDNTADDKNKDSYNFVLKEVDGLLNELEMYSNSHDDNVVDNVVIDDNDDDRTINNDDSSEQHNDGNEVHNASDILKEIDELLRQLEIDDNSNKDENDVNIVLTNNDDDDDNDDDDNNTNSTTDDNIKNKGDDDDNTDNNDDKNNDDNNSDDNENNSNNDNNDNANNDDNKSNNASGDEDDNIKISFISLDDNTQNTLDNNIYDVNPTTESISNNIYYNTNSNPKYDFELIDAKGQEQKQPQLEAWDLKDSHDENVIDNKNDILSQTLSENILNYFQIRTKLDKLTKTLQEKEMLMDMNFFLSLDDHKEKLSQFDNAISDVYTTLEDLKQDTVKLQKLEQNVYIHNLLKDVIQEQFKNYNGQK